MTTSGSNSFTQNRDQIIRRAARLIQAIAAGETPSSQMTKDFSDALNSMVKMWQATGIHVWTESEANLFVQPNQIKYLLGTPATDHCCPTDEVIELVLSSDLPLGVHVIPLVSTVGLQIGDFFGVVLNSGYMQWSTIVSVDSATQITIANDLTDSVPALGAAYSYRTKIIRPLRVLSGRRYVWNGGVSTPMNPPMARLDYRDLPLLTNTGPTTQFFYDPQLPSGIMNVWPAPPDVSAAVRFTYMRPLQDFTTPGDTGDFPVEWINTMVFGLAYVMAPEFAVPKEQYDMIEKQFGIYFDLTSSFDKEPESVYMGVNYDYR